MSLAGKEILIIDDDAEFRVLLRRVFENVGLAVREASEGEAGLALADDRVPHAIISDLDMPGVSGFDLLERVRQRPRLRAIPIIVLSANDDRASVVRALTLGAVDYALKPLNAAILLQKLRKQLRSRQFPTRRPREEAAGNGAKSRVQVRISGTIVRAGEAGLIFEAPVRLAADVQAPLISDFLAQSGLAEHPLRTTGRPLMSELPGRYLNALVVVGMAETTAAKVRRLVRFWK